MGIVNQQSGTRIDEIEAGVYRISTPVTVIPGGFTFNQYLIDDDMPLLFHSGLRRMFPLVVAAVNTVLPVERLRYVGLSHFEADECGALNEFLAVAPQAVPLLAMLLAEDHLFRWHPAGYYANSEPGICATLPEGPKIILFINELPGAGDI